MLQTAIIVGFILLIAAIVAISVAKAQSRHTFVCHSCGKEFRPRWTQLVFEVHAFDKHVLRCPHCNQKDYCTDQGKKF